MLTTNAAIEQVKLFLAECRTRLPIHIDKTILFGSMATGRNSEDSDIDLALFSSSFTNNILDNLDLIATVNIHFPDIEVHAYPTERHQRDGILMEQIRNTGIEIRA